MFNAEMFMHKYKRWTSKDGTVRIIHEMETAHLWHTFNMLMTMVNAEDAETEAAVNAIRYVGHELFLRDAKVPELPEPKIIVKWLNRADDLQRGFKDGIGEVFDFRTNYDEIGILDWDGGEFYKR